MELTGRNYIVTGAASGIGLQVSATLVQSGANVAMFDINAESLYQKAKEIDSNKCHPFVADLTDTGALKSKIKEAASLLGKLNGFIHCAGLPYVSPINVINPEKASKVYELNTYAAIELAKIMSNKSIRAEKDCAFVLISSVYGMVGSAANAAYAASKGAIIALTKALAIELAPKGIRVNCVAPGFVKTSMLGNVSGSFDSNYVENLSNLHPLGLGDATAIAEPIAFLLSDAARWITGAVLPVDGGFTAQ